MGLIAAVYEAGTTRMIRKHNGEALTENEVLYVGNSGDLVWDEGLQTVRPLSTDDVFALSKRNKRDAINTKKNAVEQGGFPYLGKIVDSDPISCQRISVAGAAASIALQAGQPFDLEWSCQDNSTLPLDAMGTLGLVQALAVWGLTCHQVAQAHKQAVEALATVAEVEAYDYSTGWPA